MEWGEEVQLVEVVMGDSEYVVEDCERVFHVGGGILGRTCGAWLSDRQWGSCIRQRDSWVRVVWD